MAKTSKKHIHHEYIARINKVQDYIEANLGDNLSLDILADISGFSKFHFCRIYGGIVRETISSYINRIRLESATSMLLHNREMSITEIAMALGYSDSAVFARAYKKHYGISASKMRSTSDKHIKENSKDSKANNISGGYNENIPHKQDTAYEEIKGNVEVRIIKELQAIYLRHAGSYEKLAKVFQDKLHRLIEWAMGKQLIGKEGLKPFVIYHDNPEYTRNEHLRTSICLAVTGDVKEEDEIGKLMIPSGKYAIACFEIDASQYPQAWDYIYGQWLPASGYQPGQGYVFEMYMNDPRTHPEHKSIVHIYLPVKPL